MRNRVLYFPYIRVPRSTWLTQMLLYWDQVSSIVPYDFIEDPEGLGTFMQELLREELVEQVQPGAYIRDIPRFAEAFGTYLNALGPEVEARRSRFRAGEASSLHIEKMQEISRLLVEVGLARAAEYPWFDVEPHPWQGWNDGRSADGFAAARSCKSGRGTMRQP